jgi:hypothetical protein
LSTPELQVLVLVEVVPLYNAMSAVRHSKVQLQVLKLYKACLRAAENKPGFKANVQFEFK